MLSLKYLNSIPINASIHENDVLIKKYLYYVKTAKLMLILQTKVSKNVNISLNNMTVLRSLFDILFNIYFSIYKFH